MRKLYFSYTDRKNLFTVAYIFPTGSIEWFAESFLIEGMSDKSDRTSQDEKSIEQTRFDIHANFRMIHTHRFEEIEEDHGDMPIDIQDEVWFFLESEDFDCEGVREESTILRRRIRMGEIVVNHLFSEEGTASVGVEFTLDLVSDSRDRCARALHPIDKVFGSFLIL